MPKKLLMWFVIAFIAFYIFTEPANAGDLLQAAFRKVGEAFGSVVTFLNSLFR